MLKSGRSLLGALALLALAPVASAQDFYVGKTIHFYIGYTPGGGYDLYSRLVARHIGRFLPGKPSVVPQNMPGGGGLTVASYMNNVPPKDGTSLAMAGSSVALDRKSTRLNSSHIPLSRMPSSA